MTLSFVLGCRLVAHAQAASTATDPTPLQANPTVPPPSVSPANSASADSNPTAISQAGPTANFGPTNTSVARMALPVTGDVGTDQTSHKWYILTASLRETYDSNSNTSSTNKQQALETSITPSLLIDFPRPDGDFSARFTGGATYYEYLNKVPDSSNVNGGGQASTGSYQFTGEGVAQYNHNFSDRFSISAADDIRYYQDPSLLQSTGTLFQNGPYLSNNFNATGTAQWTPLFGTTTSYSNTVVKYFDTLVAETQDSVENTGTQSFGFSVLPKVIASFGGIVDNIDYSGNQRGGYTSYTGFIGGTWQVLPSLSVDARGGFTYTETEASQFQLGQSSLSPYGALDINWSLGARSSLSLSYSHEITPTDQAAANGQESDRLSANFTYQINPNITAHLAAVYTYSEITSALISSSAISSYTESDYGLDAGLSYHYSNYLSFTLDANLGGVSSELDDRNYDRDQISIGVTGTY